MIALLEKLVVLIHWVALGLLFGCLGYVIWVAPWWIGFPVFAYSFTLARTWCPLTALQNYLRVKQGKPRILFVRHHVLPVVLKVVPKRFL